MTSHLKKTSQRSSSKNALASKLLNSVLLGTLSDIKRLIQEGANVESSTDDGFTPLMRSAIRGNPAITEYLIEQGADLNKRNDIGQTALMIASKGGNKKILEQLVLAGADPQALDNERRNAIAWATLHGDFPDVVSFLVALGVDYNARDSHGMTPLMSAALLGHAREVAVLLTAGADEKPKFRGKTAYDMASEKGHRKVCETIRAVLENRPEGQRF